MDRKTAEDLFPGKTYEFEGRQYRESGEVREMRKGDLYLDNGFLFRWALPEPSLSRQKILTPVETSPRILTGYDPDAKAGDVYQRDGKRWKLVELRKPVQGERFIADSHPDICSWEGVRWWTETHPAIGIRWIVVPHEGEESKADAMTDALTRISHRADGLKAILLSKHEDYGGSVYKTPRFVPQATPRDAMLIRLGDKVERLERLLGGNKANVNESVDDTLLDLAGYALLILAEKEIP